MISVVMHNGVLEHGAVRGSGEHHYIAMSLQEPESRSNLVMFFDSAEQPREIAERLNSLADEMERKNRGKT